METAIKRGNYSMKTTHNIRLTSTEIGTLWTTYISDTMAKCVLSYFLNNVEDTEIKSVIQMALDFSEDHIQEVSQLFISQEIVVPQGFTDMDVNVNAKRLFSESVYLYYVKNMTKVGIATYGMAYSIASRADIRKTFLKVLNHTEQLDQKVTEVLQSKGIYIRPPYIAPPEKADFVESKHFLSGGLFGLTEKRPLTAIEISHLFMNSQTNGLGKILLMGFSQVASSQELRKYFWRGVEIATKHVKVFTDTLKNEDLPVPMTWDSDVMNSKEAPFSDKLMIFHVTLLIAAGTGNYGLAAAASPRKDVSSNYVRLAAETALYADDGAKIMIDNGWLEEPPSAISRRDFSLKS